ncbi:cobalt ECF transporter T component CbiQ [Geitlerinema splendidum]|nr:cobalt ECF transporter T component CbiQ [Geitlerinema splendidum]
MGLELDRYAYLKSPIHQWEPRSKLISLFALILAFSFVETWVLIPVILSITAFLYILSQLPLSFWLQRIRYPGAFILAVVLILPFSSGETVLWQWGVLQLHQEGLIGALLIVSRFLAIVTLGLILFGTMPFLTAIYAMRSLGLSPLLADLLLLSYRYLFEVTDYFAQMQRAMKLRGFPSSHRRRLPLIPDRQTLSDLAAVAGTLLIRSYLQSERIYKAMQLRGYGSHSHLPPSTFSNSSTSRTWSRGAMAIAIIGAIALIVVELSL